MRFIKAFLYILLLTLAGSIADAQSDFCNARNISFQQGERLYFKVYYNVGKLWVTAGDVNFTVSNEELQGHKTYHITGQGKTIKSYDWIYKVRDLYETYIDQETMLPLRFVRNVNEGGFKIYNNVSFNHKIGQAVSTNGIYDIPKCTQDVLSAIYYSRNIDINRYKPGDKIPFNMFLDDKVYSLYIRYIGKEQITTRYGTFNAVKIAPLLIQGTIFKGGEKMLVWVSDDNNHLPLRIESPIQIGSIKVDLMGYDKLRNPITSLISKR